MLRYINFTEQEWDISVKPENLKTAFQSRNQNFNEVGASILGYCSNFYISRNPHHAQLVKGGTFIFVNYVALPKQLVRILSLNYLVKCVNF